MLDALNLPTRVRTAIGYRCEWKKISEMTLREVMELVIPDQGMLNQAIWSRTCWIFAMLEFKRSGLR